MNSLDKQAVHIADDIVAKGLANRIDATGESGPYWYLATPGIERAPLTVIASLGSPEVCGVWSYTLLSMGLIEQTSMASYFESFTHAGLGLIAINPNCNGPDLMGEAFIEQFTHTASTLNGRPLGLLGFSMGGGMALQFIEGQADIAERIAGLVLIDPTLLGRFHPRRSTTILRDQTLLIASNDPMSPGNLASQLLDVPATAFSGLHGEMPYKAISDVVEFFRKKATRVI